MDLHKSARGAALLALRDWRHGRQFADAIVQQLLAGSPLSGADRAFVIELFYGVLRHLSLLDFWIAQLRSGSVDDRSRDLLRLGLYQLFCLEIPDHATVFETVALAPRTSRPLINGALRTATRRAQELKDAADRASLAIRTSHPEFLIAKWTAAFGAAAAETICRWNNKPPPIYTRVNSLRTTAEEFVAKDAMRARLPEKSNFVRVANVPIEALERGECYVQDPSTSESCTLLDPQPGETVLDACAAPGGKTGYLAELMKNKGTLIACDRDPARLEMLASNLQRLGVTNARVIKQDWTAPALAKELAELRFDRILIDAPCSNTGVMRRRVDVRWRLRPDDFKRMAAEQFAILCSSVRLLKPGGTLVFSTCSIEAEENEQVVARALREFPFLLLADQVRVVPYRDGFDGAFAAKFVAQVSNLHDPSPAS